VPALHDPNTGVSVFESGACIEYIAATYDTKHQLGYEDATKKWELRSWVRSTLPACLPFGADGQQLFFQCAGQGPFFGQKTWFSRFHQQKELTSAIERYDFEVRRIMGVVESVLRKQQQGQKAGDSGPWLVGDKYTYADLAFVSWNNLLEFMYPEKSGTGWIKEEFSLFWDWWQRMLALPSVKLVLEQKKVFNETLEDSANEARQRTMNKDIF
jgi:glutathione S-transferase